MKVWSWRDAVIQSKELRSHSKHILLTLSVYMNEKGHGCYPSLSTLMEDTGLARGTLVKYLKEAADAGFIIKKEHGFSGQGWKRHEYIATYPQNTKLFYYNDDKNAVHQANHVDEKGSSPNEPRNDEGGSPHIQKAVHPVDSITPTNTPRSSSNHEDNQTQKNDNNNDLKKIKKILGEGLWNPMKLEDWKRAGADIDQHIIPAIKTALKRNKNKVPNSLNYFDNIIAEYIKSFPKAKGNTPPSPKLPAIEPEKNDEYNLQILGDTSENLAFLDACRRLQKKIGKSNFAVWIAHIRLKSLHPFSDTTVLIAPNRFIKERVERNYLEHLQKLWPTAGQINLVVEGKK